MNDVSQLALSIQRGRDDLIPELWEAVRGLVGWFAMRFYLLREDECNRHKIEVEDLVQEGFFALLDSIRKYDPEKGAFSTFLAWDLRHGFQAAIGRTTRQRGDMLNNCLSLDAELDSEDPDSESLIDYISDGVDYAAAVEHKVYLQQLREELEKVLAAIPAEQAEVIKESFYNGRTLTEIAAAKAQTVENIRRKKENGLRELR
ncbi:MAG: sigma-70 family RNA polymerase sigma factor [Oscillospiraceae bacterium]|nr:sigma-70 family RNA polymerase sigma factor [Oscillospiraceae bacterium]